LRNSIFIPVVITIFIVSCINKTGNLNRLIKHGEFSKAIKLIDYKLQKKDNLSKREIEILKKNLSDLKAVKNDYTKTHDEVFKELQEKITYLTEKDMQKWEKDYGLEY